MATDQWLSTVPTGQCFSKWLALAGLLSVNLADPITIFLEFFSSRQNFFFRYFTLQFSEIMKLDSSQSLKFYYKEKKIIQLQSLDPIDIIMTSSIPIVIPSFTK